MNRDKLNQAIALLEQTPLDAGRNERALHLLYDVAAKPAIDKGKLLELAKEAGFRINETDFAASTVSDIETLERFAALLSQPASVQAPSDERILAVAEEKFGRSKNFSNCFDEPSERGIVDLVRALLSQAAPQAEQNQPANWGEDSSLETWFPLTADELASTKRMLLAACADLGRINEALGLDPDDGGADPILDAIAELKAAGSPVSAPAVSELPALPEPEHDYITKPGFTADQMRAYAQAAIALTRPEPAAHAQPTLLQGSQRADFIERIVLGVAEIADRDSPEDQPEMMLVTCDELRSIIEGAFDNADEEARLAAPAQDGEATSSTWHSLVIKLGCFFNFDTAGSLEEVAASAASARDSMFDLRMSLKRQLSTARAAGYAEAIEAAKQRIMRNEFAERLARASMTNNALYAVSFCRMMAEELSALQCPEQPATRYKCIPKDGGNSFIIDRAPDSWELRECDIETVSVEQPAEAPKCSCYTADQEATCETYCSMKRAEVGVAELAEDGIYCKGCDCRDDELDPCRVAERLADERRAALAQQAGKEQR